MKLVFLITTLLMVSMAQAERVVAARVLEVQGKAFNFEGSKNFHELNFADKIYLESEVAVDDQSQLVLMDRSGSKFYINSGTSLSFTKEGVKVSEGEVWVKAKSDSNHVLSSSNAKVVYSSDQFVFTVKQDEQKTQLLTLVGTPKFSSQFEPQIIENVTAGQFSVIDSQKQAGLPRVATNIGPESFEQTKARFKYFKGLEQINFIEESKPKRSIASVPKKREQRRGKIITLKTIKPVASLLLN